MNAGHRGCRARALAHEYDAFHHIVIIHYHAVSPMDGFADLAETDLRPLRDHPNVLDAQSGAGLRLQDGFFDVGHACDQAHFPDVYLLRALLDEASASVRIGVGELLLDLRQAESVGDQLLRVDDEPGTRV